MLSKEQTQRYQRNLVLSEIGEKGQEQLLNSNILIIGAGGLGSAAIFYLAAAGVGNLTIIDDDIVEISNLQRQIIHNFSDLNKAKVKSASEKIFALNSDVAITTFQRRADKEFLAEILADFDLVFDCTDNFSSRFIINAACIKAKKPLVFAAVKGFLGQVSIFKSYEDTNPCYACFNPNILPKDFSLPLSEKGILGSVAGSIGALQATSGIKEILGIGQDLVGKILIFDFLENKFRKVKIPKNKNCRHCHFN